MSESISKPASRRRYPTTEEKRDRCAPELRKMVEACGADIRVRAIPNNMAAGPCAACFVASQKAILAIDAPPAPLDGCPHPDQCAVRYTIELNLD